VKIIYIDRSGWWGGAEESLAWLAGGMARRGHEVEIVADYPEPHQTRYPQDSLTVTPRMRRMPIWAAERWRSAPRGLDRLGMLARARWLATRLEEQRADIVHINLLRDRSRWDAKAARGGGSAVVGHLRQLRHQSMPSRETLALCDQVVAVSEFIAEQARALGCNAPLDVIYDGADAGKFVFAADIPAARTTIGAPAGGRLIGFPAVLEPRKGQDVALAAFAQIAADYPDATLAFAGPHADLNDAAAYLTRLKRRAAESDLAGRVRFLGPCENMAALYAASDVILALSRDGEAFGRVPMEAALTGRPVVATNAGATTEVIVDGVTGLLATPGDANSVEGALRRLLANPSFANEIAINAQARAARLFGSGAALDAFEALYVRTCNRRSS
jgi:glycosyltransferase involved in cell wall biosynthesis